VEAKTKKKNKRIDRSSIPNCMGKIREREEYICGIYPSILNCGYRNDRIISDWTKYGSPDRDERR